MHEAKGSVVGSGVAVEAGVTAKGAGGDQGAEHQRKIGIHRLGQRDDDGHGLLDEAPEGSAGKGDQSDG